MLIYLSKKIAIPNQKKVKTVCWSINHGFIACGAENGLLKVFKLDNSELKYSHFNLPKNLSMNQNLVGHTGSVLLVIWNERYQKLTSTDSNGLIIVWMLYKGIWYEEMVNNRNKSTVVGMVWSNDGLRICIVYEDGAVIVGSVDGSRLWSKDIKSVKLTSVEWSPDGKILLFGTVNRQVFCYDNTGNFIFNVPLPMNGVLGRQMNGSGKVSVTNIDWLSNVNSKFRLVIAFNNGILQLMKNECDENSILIDTKMLIVDVKWSLGNIFAVIGRCETEDNNLANCVKFYDSYGKFIQTLKVPGSEISACSWEKEGFRLVIGVDCYLFFINIKPTYKWGYFSSSLVFAFPANFRLMEETNLNTVNLVFCQMQSNTKQIRSVKNLIQLSAFNQFCVFATSLDEIPAVNGVEDQVCVTKLANITSLILCNTFGTPVDSVDINLKVKHIAINSTRVIGASSKHFAIWTFTTFSQKLTDNNSNFLTDVTHINSNENVKASDLGKNINIIQVPSSNSNISCICVSDKILVIGQENGTFLFYLLPEASLSQKFSLSCFPKMIKLNSNSTKLSIIDTNDTLYICELSSGSDSEKSINFEKKEVWDFCWCLDNVNAFAIAEKSKLILYSDFESDEAVQSCGYICEYKDLMIRTAAIDSLIAEFFFGEKESIQLDKFINEIEIKSLREFRQILAEKGIEEAVAFCESVSHPKLWRLLAEASLKNLDFQMAEKALVHCQDFKDIQFVKKIAKLPKEEMKKAEVNAYFKLFDEAEQNFLEIDRKDLAINLRKIVQNWFQVLNLMKSDINFSNDAEVREATIKLGDVFVENHEWSRAAQLYEEAEAWEKLIDCYIVLDDFEGLKKLVKHFENIPLLIEFGTIFEFNNMCLEAVESYSRANRLDLAIKCCINLNEWKLAMDLAHTNKVDNINSLLSEYASHLISKSKFVEIVELYRKANKIYDAVGILSKMVRQIQKSSKTYFTSPLLLKKIYTLISYLYLDLSSQNQIGEKKQALESLLNSNFVSDNFFNTDIKDLDQPWKGAEAFHFYILAHKQLYEGHYLRAMQTSLNLIDYDDYIELENIFNLIAISSFANKNFYICSKAFIKLESCEKISKDQRLIYSNLAFEIFTQHKPIKPAHVNLFKCSNCATILEDWLNTCPECNNKFTVCIASGQSILKQNSEWSCLKCKHYAIKNEIIKFNNCPLCHYPIDNL